MDTPIYDKTKESFENLKKQVDSVKESVYSKVDDIIDSGKKIAADEVSKLKSYCTDKAVSLKNNLQNQATKQIEGITSQNKKVQKMMKLLETLKEAPSLDTITTWATAAAEIYASQYIEIVEKAVDIAKTTQYLSSEVPSLVKEATQMVSDISNKVDELSKYAKDTSKDMIKSVESTTNKS